MPVPSVVIDTNVLIAAAFKPASDSARLIGAVRDRRVRLVWNGETLAETRTLMRRIPPVSFEAVEDLFEDSHRAEDGLDTSGFCSVSDPDDRKFAALAAFSGATLVSLDAHLLEAARRGDYLACTPSAFLRSEKPRSDPPDGQPG